MAWKSWGIAGQSLKVNYAVHLKQHCSGQIKCLIHQNKNAIKSFFITVQQNTGLDLKKLKSQYELDCTIFFFLTCWWFHDWGPTCVPPDYIYKYVQYVKVKDILNIG